MIINLLRNRRTVMTAQQIGEKIGVSTRTVYRDIQRLEVAGLPLEGEAGVGYRVTRGFDMPPLMFDSNEVEALILGMRMVRAWSDEQLAASAESALNKIIGVLPAELKDLESETSLRVPVFPSDARRADLSPTIRAAIKARQVLSIRYTDANETSSQRLIWPLGLFFWGNVWTLLSWCTLRKDYRTFRMDRIQSIDPLQEFFEESTEISMSHYLLLVQHRTR